MESMADSKDGSKLEVPQDLRFQQGSWTAQRLGWALLALLLLAALLGLFGAGPLSRATSGAQDGPLWAEYHRFWRYKYPMSLRIHFGPEATRHGEVRVRISRPYLESMSVEHVTPQPQSVEAGPDHLTYVFKISRVGYPTAVTFDLKPNAPGSVTGRAGLDSGPEIAIGHFIYPSRSANDRNRELDAATDTLPCRDRMQGQASRLHRPWGDQHTRRPWLPTA